MELGKIAEVIIAAQHRLENEGIYVKFYYFGSALKENILSSDIDILVIYQKDNEPQRVRIEISELSNRLPIDLYFMTPLEVLELSFIKNTSAIEVRKVQCNNSKNNDYL